MVSAHRNKIEDLINKLANLKINVGNENNLINKALNITINYTGNNLNRAKASDLQFQFVDDLDGKKPPTFIEYLDYWEQT